MEAGIKKISAIISGGKGWIILKDKKLVGFIRKMEDGDYKWYYETYSEYGPCAYTNSVESAIKDMINSDYY
jgi:hypothetical protein